MSYDLTARSDDAYSVLVSRQLIFKKIRNEAFNLKFNGKSNFVSEAKDGFYINIDVELVNSDGDNIEANETKLSKKVNCINFYVSGEITEKNILRTMYIAFQIADSLGWKVIDNQTEDTVTFEVQATPWWKFW